MAAEASAQPHAGAMTIWLMSNPEAAVFAAVVVILVAIAVLVMS